MSKKEKTKELGDMTYRAENAMNNEDYLEVVLISFSIIENILKKILKYYNKEISGLSKMINNLESLRRSEILIKKCFPSFIITNLDSSRKQRNLIAHYQTKSELLQSKEKLYNVSVSVYSTMKWLEKVYTKWKRTIEKMGMKNLWEI